MNPSDGTTPCNKVLWNGIERNMRVRFVCLCLFVFVCLYFWLCVCVCVFMHVCAINMIYMCEFVVSNCIELFILSPIVLMICISMPSYWHV